MPEVQVVAPRLDAEPPGPGLARAVDDAPRVTPLNPALMRLMAARQVLLLQGPVGPFFDRLAKWLRRGGAEVRRIAFQAGDERDCGAVEPIRFTREVQEWPAFFSNLATQLEIDCVVLFGQSRQYHQDAIAIARARGIAVIVMEEGYFRPGFGTMELDGVNGYSSTLYRYTWQTDVMGNAVSESDDLGIRPDISPWHFQKMAWHAATHYAALWRHRSSYPDYVHHRGEDPFHYAAYWMRSWMRKIVRRGPQLRLQAKLFEGGPTYFMVPLQLDGDSQLVYHSTFGKNPEFISEVLLSFARHAPAAALLVFKEHPHSRGGPGYEKLVRRIARDLGVEDRIRYMVEGDTPALAEHSAGVVVINSTVGLQALERGVPLMVMGDALYDQPKLTFQGELDEFWANRQAPNPEMAKLFLAQLKNLTQVPVSLYALGSEPLVWNAEIPSTELQDARSAYVC
ncbi:MAG: capsular polysaccharide export protein, LipB/KpsS family [Ramlibacter sp.]